VIYNPPGSAYYTHIIIHREIPDDNVATQDNDDLLFYVLLLNDGDVFLGNFSNRVACVRERYDNNNMLSYQETSAVAFLLLLLLYVCALRTYKQCYKS